MTRTRTEAVNEEKRRPHQGDGIAASAMERALPSFQAALEQAWRSHNSDESHEVLGMLIDDAMPALRVWIDCCKEKGEF
jgi:hypothetical protein